MQVPCQKKQDGKIFCYINVKALITAGIDGNYFFMEGMIFFFFKMKIQARCNIVLLAEPLIPKLFNITNRHNIA